LPPPRCRCCLEARKALPSLLSSASGGPWAGTMRNVPTIVRHEIETAKKKKREKKDEPCDWRLRRAARSCGRASGATYMRVRDVVAAATWPSSHRACNESR
jgi:hypothetical protein